MMERSVFGIADHNHDNKSCSTDPSSRHAQHGESRVLDTCAGRMDPADVWPEGLQDMMYEGQRRRRGLDARQGGGISESKAISPQSAPPPKKSHIMPSLFQAPPGKKPKPHT